MIDKFGNWTWASIEEYKRYEPMIVAALKESLRYTWKQYVQKQSLLHIPGLYILFDKSNEKVYVGRSTNIANRIQHHKGSTIKAALKRGDELIIRIIPCVVGSELWWAETVLIKYYDLRYTCINSQSLIYVRDTDDLSQFKKEEFDA